MKALIEQLEAGHSEALTAYLNAMSRFHNYSFGNILGGDRTTEPGRHTLHSLRANAGVIYRSAVYMNLDEGSRVERTAVAEAARAWAHRHYRNTMAKGPEQTEREFRLVTCCWLRFAGRLQEPARPLTPHQAELSCGSFSWRFK